MRLFIMTIGEFTIFYRSLNTCEERMMQVIGKVRHSELWFCENLHVKKNAKMKSLISGKKVFNFFCFKEKEKMKTTEGKKINLNFKKIWN